MKSWCGRTEDRSRVLINNADTLRHLQSCCKTDSKSMACHVNRCYYYQHGSHYPRQSQTVTCCYISHKATDMFERNEQLDSAQRPGRPTDRQTDHIHFSAWMSYKAFKALQLQKTWLHLTLNIFSSLVLRWVSEQVTGISAYSSSVAVYSAAATPTYGAMHPLPTSCKDARLFRRCSLQIS
jgi:hypothetical protein